MGSQKQGERESTLGGYLFLDLAPPSYRLTQGLHITYQLGVSENGPEHVVIGVSCIRLKDSYKGSYASP